MLIMMEITVSMLHLYANRDKINFGGLLKSFKTLVSYQTYVDICYRQK